MVTTKKAQQMLAERGIEVGYPTLAQWTREGKFEGAQLEATERGPVWRIPIEAVRAFKPPKMGRPKSPEANTSAIGRKRAINGASTKKKGSKK